MLLTSTNRNSAILQNIVQTLAQIKLTGQVNQPVLIDSQPNTYVAGDDLDVLSTDFLVQMTLTDLEELGINSPWVYTVSFYTDQARTQLLFTDNSASSPDNFSTVSGRVFYTPLDTRLNDAALLSSTKSQPLYYLTVTKSNGSMGGSSHWAANHWFGNHWATQEFLVGDSGPTTNSMVAYVNSANLLFQSVIVSTKKNPPFALNQNQAIIVPIPETQRMKAVSGIHGHMIAAFEIHLQLILPNWPNMSELQRYTQQQGILNLIRNALYTDRYRNGNCTMLDKDLNGTCLREFRVTTSDAVLRGCMKCETVYWIDNDSLF